MTPSSRPIRKGRSWRTRLRGVLAAVALSGLSVVAPSQEQTPTAAQVKAAYLYHFTTLIEWPESPAAETEPFVIAVVNAESFAAVLEDVVGHETARKRSLKIVRTRAAGALPPSVHVVFVGARNAREARVPLAAAKDGPVLTVGDYDGFAADGGMIGFRITDDGRVSFDINLAETERAGLKVSSQLLKLARIVGPRS